MKDLITTNENLDARFLGSWADKTTGNLYYFNYRKVVFKTLSKKVQDEFLQGTFIRAPYILPSVGTTAGEFNTHHGVKIDLIYHDSGLPVQTYIYSFSPDGNKLYLGDFKGNISMEFVRAVSEETIDYAFKDLLGSWAVEV